MSWQNTFNLIFGPGLFAGIKTGDLFRLLRNSHFVVRPRYGLRCLSAVGASVANSIHSRIEQQAFGRCLPQQTIPPPLFILGHWRSGTTYLHNLLSQDDRFAFPNLYQVLYPHTFLTTEAVNARLMSFLVPRTRFGIDNVAISWAAPYEDEFAIAIMSGLSPYVTMALPRKQPYYDRFLTLRDASPDELIHWRATLTSFLKKLTWKHGRPLILKVARPHLSDQAARGNVPGCQIPPHPEESVRSVPVDDEDVVCHSAVLEAAGHALRRLGAARDTAIPRDVRRVLSGAAPDTRRPPA
ncbi:MAG TPA: sulfotransferase [Pirellulales bacterium]|nr:sulfotransferase [Pirellulales bacterium]